MPRCQCGYPDTPCDKHKHDFLHDCVAAGYNGGLKPQNIVQAAEADMKRAMRNAEQVSISKEFKVHYEQYAFHRDHVRRSFNKPRDLILLALMDPTAAMKTAKDNTKLIYGDARLLIAALHLSR